MTRLKTRKGNVKACYEKNKWDLLCKGCNSSCLVSRETVLGGTRWYSRYPDEAPVLEKCVLFSIQVIFNPHK